MSNGFFQFKQFTVWHDRCAMKVGTDGVLLGAWASAEQVRRALDVGCGSGLIGLMLAQRYPQAEVVGIEIDPEAADQAAENMAHSPWTERMQVVKGDFCDYHPAETFDLIVSNPPYFVDALRSPVGERSLARHAAGLNYESLFRKSHELLAEGGRICVILPAEAVALAVDAASRNQLFPDHKICVYTKQGKPLRRVMLSFGTSIEPCQTTDLYLMNADGSYAASYRQLTAHFYLNL